MACVCGHAIEEHEDERGECEGKDSEGDDCMCVAFDDEDDEDDGGDE